MAIQFKKAVVSEAKLRIALYGPAGSGKTYTSLRIARGLAECINSQILVIDSERGSASKYADRFEFYVYELNTKKAEEYIEVIKEAQKHYKIIIVDSLSHAWLELLERVDLLTQTKYKGNSLQAWSEVSLLYKTFVDTLLSVDAHVIATMRVKTDWSVEKDSNTGKIKPVKVGLAPEQRAGIEYEFDILGELNSEHTLFITKDRSGFLQDRIITKPGEDLGRELGQWLTGKSRQESQDTTQHRVQNGDLRERFEALCRDVYGDDIESVKKRIFEFYKVQSFDEMPPQTQEEVVKILAKKLDKKRSKGQ